MVNSYILKNQVQVSFIKRKKIIASKWTQSSKTLEHLIFLGPSIFSSIFTLVDQVFLDHTLEKRFFRIKI